MGRRINAPPLRRRQELGGTVQLLRVQVRTLGYHNRSKRTPLPLVWEGCTCSWVPSLTLQVSLYPHCGR